MMAFDRLADGDESAARRASASGGRGSGHHGETHDRRGSAQAEHWLDTIEGVIAKELDAPYRPGKRLGMFKVKRVRTVDAVVLGYRPGVEDGTVGSLILGMYDASGHLQPMGHASGFAGRLKRDLLERVRPLETGERGSGDPSRWSQGRELEWVALRPELVVEVSFDHASGGRIRHGARLLRFRDDKQPQECLLTEELER